MDGRYAEKAPNYLNTEHSSPLSNSLGVNIYNWQSSATRESGVYRYKQQWGSSEVLGFLESLKANTVEA